MSLLLPIFHSRANLLENMATRLFFEFTVNNICSAGNLLDEWLSCKNEML